MAARHSQICNIAPAQLTNLLSDRTRKVRLIDCRSFLEFNDNHITGAVNICCSKLIKRRLQQEKISLKDLLLHCRIEIEETSDVIVYDQRSETFDDVLPDSFIYVLLKKLILVFDKVNLLAGGFVSFHSLHPEHCENKVWKYPGLTALSQPCLPTTSTGPTRILPFLYLGSEEDANNRELLQSHNITYELNVSNKCPKPDFISEGHFLRIPVNDSHSEKLLPYFVQAFQFIDKARESNESVLVHCLAGISRSPTVAIAYVMRHLQMTCEDAYRYVKAKRATISPNFNFLGQLLEYEKQLISEHILEKNHPAQTSICSTSTSQKTDFLFGPPSVLSLSPPATSSIPSTGRRVNLSLRLTPFTGLSGLSSPKDASPTTAMARLQFDKPQGKENRTGTSSSQSSGGFSIPGSMGVGFGVARPTRLVKEQNVTSIQEEEVGQWESVTKSVTHQSLSISFSKGFKSNRRSSFEQFQHQSDQAGSSGNIVSPTSEDGCGFESNKKCRVHKIFVEGLPIPTRDNDMERSARTTCSTDSLPSCCTTSSLADDGSSLCGPSLSSPLGLGYKREYLRSDSVSTSGIGSEISEHDLLASGSWDMTESGNVQDDGVFSDGSSLYPKSPKPSRQLQLWSSDSGHWSSTDDGVSCTSSSIEIPSAACIGEAKSPEKRKCSESLFDTSRLSLTSLEKRRSYAGASSSDWTRTPDTAESRPKRWSLAEDAGEPSKGSSNVAGSECEGLLSDREATRLSKLAEGCQCFSSERVGHMFCSNSSSSSRNHLCCGHPCLNVLSGRELTCCDRQGDGLYRVHSCPGILGYHDWVHDHNLVPDSPPEPLSDSVLLKVKSCRNRGKHQKCFDSSAGNSWRNRYSCGSIDYDDLWSKLQSAQDAKTDSSHSSSSTLASSSFSVVVQ